MRKLSVFNFISLDGYYKGANNEISWHKHAEEENEYSADGLSTGSILLFGRITYEMMLSFWPTQMAIESMPVVAEGMNSAEKIVFSRTMKNAAWNNTKVINENIVEEIKTLKQLPGKDLTILGSGSILTLFAEHGLIDEYQIMVDPVAIGSGTPIFKNMKKELDLKLTNTRTFKSGTVLLCYEPA
jgi:dihydrofolate reductase